MSVRYDEKACLDVGYGRMLDCSRDCRSHVDVSVSEARCSSMLGGASWWGITRAAAST
jgi:hypothetical protein